ncbi:DUF4190 domain-containing protein [Nocardia niigatensis]|uniref:DUF4190 domain-containing protein n=1 Tax=Nocardia niigatensis TaxID=209249 RepID=UPI0003047B35|nr:DUF4190 domain-containing protein [Nocardia niigatensis]
MTTPGDSDEWWKQYGGEGVTPETPPAAPPQSAPPPAGYTSAPQYQNPPLTPPPQPVYPNYQPPQANPMPSYPSYPAAGQQSPAYGQPGYQPYGYGAPVQQTNSLAIASLVVSIIGVPAMFFCAFLPIVSIVGLVLGIVALNQLKNTQQQGRGLALGGVWVSGISIVIGVALFLILIIAGATGSS